MRALGETSSEKGRVERQEDPRAALKQDSRQEDAHPKEDFQTRDDGHGCVVVLLDKGTNPISQWAADALRRSTVDSGRWRLEYGDQIGPSVCRNVKDRIHAVWQKRKGILRGEEPDQGHD